MNDVIQINPNFDGDRAAALLLIQSLEHERHRIEAELKRINDRITGVIDPSDYPHIDLLTIQRDLQTLLDRVNQELAAHQQRPS